MSVRSSFRFPLILGGVLASIGVLFWPFVKGSRQAAQRAGIT